MRKQPDTLKYGLEDVVPRQELPLYTLQHIVYFAAGIIVLPIAVGLYLGLSQGEIAEFLQRTFFLCGVVTLLQLSFGHRYPIIDGPAGLWASMLIVMCLVVSEMGGSLGELRRDLQLGILIAGGLVVLLAASGLIVKISKLFTPIVNGVIILLMVLQMSETFIRGALGVTDESPAMDQKQMLVFLVTIVAILVIAVYARGFLQSIATLLGVAAGWVLAVLMGLSEHRPAMEQIFSIPRMWAFGTPSFDPGVTITCVIGALVLLSMSFASLNSMAEAVGETVTDRRLSKTVLFHGVATILTGIFAVIPFMPFVSSTGVVLMTGVAARKPFRIACVCMIVFGIFSPVAAFLSSMPSTVAYAASTVVFSLILGQGLKEFQKVRLTNRESYIIGISMISGMGVMFLPDQAFSALPETVHFIASNGLVTGTILAMALEQIFRKKEA